MWMKWMAFLTLFFLTLHVLNPLQATENRKIKVIVFDFSSVIVKTDKKEVADYIAHTLHISPEETMEMLKQLKESNAQGREEPQFWMDYAQAKKMQLPDHWLEKLNAVRFQALHEIPGMVDLVKNLQAHGYQTALLSNVRKCQAEVKRKLGLYELFNPLLLSYEIEAKKPEPKAFQILLNTLKVPPQAVLFIDNKPENVEAAKSLGIDGIVFINRDQLVAELQKRGIELSPSPKMPPE